MYPVLAAASSVIIGSACLSITPRILAGMGMYDVPNSRSSHDQPILRGAGLAVGLTTVMVLVGASFFGPPSGRLPLITLGLVALGCTALGFVEDRRGLGIGSRLRCQAILSLAGAIGLNAAVKWNWVVLCAGVVLLLSYINVSNFMDGINGISAMHGVVGGAWFTFLGLHAGVAWLSVGGSIAAAAFAAFLPWNTFRRPVLFLGDAGSYVLGGLLAALTVGATLAGVHPWISLSVLSVYFTDAGLTLLRRLAAGHPLTEPHREHVYQRLVQAGVGHIPVATVVAAFSGGVALLALLGASTGARWLLLVCVSGQVLLLVLYASLPKLRRTSSSPRVRGGDA